MKLYGGIDLHSNNLVLSITDEADNIIYEKRLIHDRELLLKTLSVYQKNLVGWSWNRPIIGIGWRIYCKPMAILFV
jgi:hypothetical protein